VQEGLFDAYILFWPVTHDALRLLMAVHLALRGRWRLAELESLLEQYAATGGLGVDIACRSLRQAEHNIGAALDGLSRRLPEGGCHALGEMGAARMRPISES